MSDVIRTRYEELGGEYYRAATYLGPVISQRAERWIAGNAAADCVSILVSPGST